MKKDVGKILTELERQFGRGAVQQLGPVEGGTTKLPVIPTGFPALDRALGVDGYPKGCVVEVFGAEASGKTTLALHAVAECQRQGGLCAFVDAEHTLDVKYAASLGVRVEDLLVSQPDHGEQALQIVEALVRSKVVDLVVVDGLSSLPPRAEVEGEEALPMGLQARRMSQALCGLTGAAHQSDAVIILTHRPILREAVTFGCREVGGNALRFYASMRIELAAIGTVQGAGDCRVRAKVVKNRLASPFQMAEFFLTSKETT